MTKLLNWTGAKLSVALATVAAVLSFGAAAYATDPVSDAFTSGQSSLTGYITQGVGVIVAVLLLGLGIGLLVKYLRKAVRAA